MRFVTFKCGDEYGFPWRSKGHGDWILRAIRRNGDWAYLSKLGPKKAWWYWTISKTGKREEKLLRASLWMRLRCWWFVMVEKFRLNGRAASEGWKEDLEQEKRNRVRIWVKPNA